MPPSGEDKLIKVVLKQIGNVKRFVSEAEKRSEIIINRPPIGPWPKKILKQLIRLEKQLLKAIRKLERKVQSMKKAPKGSSRKRAAKAA